MKKKQDYTIQIVKKTDISQVVDFIMRIRSEIFPMLSKDQLPSDLLHFQSFYLQRKTAIMYAAYTQTGQVIGTIAICPYDGRFEHLQPFYQDSKTAEIVKCYVDPHLRRSGVGSRLFREVLQFSRNVGYQKLYLHTHPFLPGAIPFWQALGFEKRWKEDDPLWQTIHMDQKL